ncbi:DNA topoisomerase [Rhodoplanes elegans]|uniref:DNA topoisomerase n=2 Tax=Rhodoplanes elegans TaxID=29408 RepID=A0A327KN16_9BRAD|nr:DNA topoisomerase [Rhodoplanes elegans]RAI39366.1 DNA topoisomerase [Rhodoplanes elegans]
MPKSSAAPSPTPGRDAEPAPCAGGKPCGPGGRRADRLTRRIGLVLVEAESLSIRRMKRGRGWSYVDADGTPVRDPETLARFASLAVPPAYADVRFAADPRAHIQAIGRDDAGRTQYRYHPDWVKVRERRKAQRLLRLVQRLPVVRRAVTRHLSAQTPNRAFALACAIELIACTAIRAGDEAYARQRGTRGAATLLKSNVRIEGDTVALSFKAKGGKAVSKAVTSARLAAALRTLLTLPGRRLFQYRGAADAIHIVRRQDINAFLQEVAGAKISVKDFRTLCASAMVLETLARTVPAASARGRRKQVLEAVRAAADSLANTPAICRKSYVHETVVTAFETGVLEGFSATMKQCRTAARREQIVAQVLVGMAS